MGINRYDKAPEWNPGVLPYELILKAADMTQQRWDKARAESDQEVSDIFKNVRTVPQSQDELGNLPAIRSKYKELQNQLITDPDMNPTKYSMAINNFVSESKPLLDRMTSLADLYKANNTALASKMMDPDFRADNKLLPWLQFNPQDVDSRSQDPWEANMNYKFTQNWGTHIEGKLLNKWVGSAINPQAMIDPTTGAFTTEFGKTIADLEEKANTGAVNYMQSENFNDFISGDRELLGTVPDDVLSQLGGKTYFDGKAMYELTPYEQAKAMIMLTGAEQINSKVNIAKGLASSSDGKTDKPQMQAPVNAYVASDQVTPKDFAAFNGLQLQANGTVIVDATDQGITQFGNRGLTNEQEVKEANYNTVQEENMAKLGLSAPIKTMYTLSEKLKQARIQNRAFHLFDDNNYSVEKRNFFSSILDLPSGMTDKNFTEFYVNMTKEYKAATDELAASVANLDTSSPEWLAIQNAALEMGEVITKPSDVVALNNKLLKAQLDKSAKMTEEEMIQEVRSKMGYKIMNSGEAPFRVATGEKNVVSVDDKRFIKGYITFGPTVTDDGKEVLSAEENFVNYMERVAPDMFDMSPLDSGTYGSFGEFWEDIGSKIMKVNPGTRGGSSFSLQYYLPEQINTPIKAQSFNRQAAGVGSTYDANQDAWNSQYPEVLMQLNETRVADNIAKTKGAATAISLTMQNVLNNKRTPKAVSNVLLPLLKQYKESNDYKGLARLNILIREGIASGWPAEIVDGISGNPTQPQGQQGNPLGGIR
jgi:hypothetical protein